MPLQPVLCGLGVRTALGRLAVYSAANEIVISDGLWRRRFESDPEGRGSSGAPQLGTHRSVGVLGLERDLPMGRDNAADLGAPPTLPIPRGPYPYLQTGVFGQIRRSARLSRAWLPGRQHFDQGRADVRITARAWEGNHPDWAGVSSSLVPLVSAMGTPFSRRAPGWHRPLMLEEGARRNEVPTRPAPSNQSPACSGVRLLDV